VPGGRRGRKSNFLLAVIVILSLPGAFAAERGPALVGEVPPQITPESLHCFWASRSKPYRTYRKEGVGAEVYARYDRLAYLFQELADKYGLRWDLAFLQMLGETGFLTYEGEVHREQNNVSGLGADGFWLREDGAAWLSGDRFGTLREGVEAFLQHLALWTGQDLPQEQLLSPHSRKNKTHIAAVRKAWRKLHPDEPFSVSDLGTLVQTYTGKLPSMIWADNPKYGSDIMANLKLVLAHHVARDMSSALLLRFYDRTNVTHMRSLRKKLADLQAQIKVFEDFHTNRVADYERTQREIREGGVANLRWHSNNLKRVRGDASKARPHDKKILEGQAKDIGNQLKTKEIHLRISGVGRSYAAWEAILAQNEKEFATFQKEFARGEFPVRVNAWGAITRNSVEAEIAKVEQELEECLAGTKAYDLVGGSPAMSRIDILELLKESGGACGGG